MDWLKPSALLGRLLLWLPWLLRRALVGERTRARIARKRSFLRRAGRSYGYAGSAAGHIDTWRTTELPGLIGPVGGASPPGAVAYLDYAGSALPLASQCVSRSSPAQRAATASTLRHPGAQAGGHCG